MWSKTKILGTKFLAKSGMDRAVLWTLITQGFRFLTGPISMILMIHYLSLETQGYYYAFGSVLGLSLFLELGFSQNILQFASHEFSKLAFAEDKRLRGDHEALSRFISLGRLSFKYYGVAAVIFGVGIIFGGIWFFKSSPDPEINWQIPWIIACISSAVSLAINPCWALLEGCNQIAEVERVRFLTSLLSFVVIGLTLILGGGLYAAAFSSLAAVIFSISFLVIKWRGFFVQFNCKPQAGTISWKKEIWPFQWRLAISCISGYFIFFVITPVIFKISGAAAAAKIGFTLQLVRMVSTVASSWSTTKLPLYGMLVARQDWTGLSEIWKKSTRQTLLVATIGSVGMLICMQMVGTLYPKMAERYAGPIGASFLALSMIVQCYTFSCSYFLRAFKKEPYMALSIINAVLSLILIVCFTFWWGVTGAAAGYSAAILIVAIPAYQMFIIKRAQFINDSPSI